MSDVKYWDNMAKTVLEGKKIIKAEYISEEEALRYGWDYRGVSLILDDNTRIIVMRDDEGNNAGVLAYLNEGVDSVLPVLRD
ncbi:MAG: hypothetical protein Unbinned3338contig1000_35 [Prokaryotic dsDNA virus sp.]|nr:MAG: hypothetical protein Unbinned3338contig1000_35 [Prokaryotic dsDNA virus sp.]